ncbi:DNA polymerase III subunit chi [Gallaecimonas sp. GXIMD4217]|uniref:DNA polymerase III subunit chi n=1 Tax=Gallaecimonas sp. GXIMD4217 TaxID=3131927 RepID=UPI00311B29AD
MQQVTFCLLGDSSLTDFAARLAKHCYQQQKPCLVYCATQAQAEAVDEALWTLAPDDFVPHNLAGEGPRSGAPVLIAWEGSGPVRGRPALINLHDSVPQVAVHCQDIFEAVPEDDSGKQAARQRFVQYRQQGIQPATAPLPDVLAQTHR